MDGLQLRENSKRIRNYIGENPAAGWSVRTLQSWRDMILNGEEIDFFQRVPAGRIGFGMKQEKENRIPLDDLRVFHGLARSLTSSFDLDTILRTILEHMERFIHAEKWTLWMRDGEDELYCAISAGGKREEFRDLRLKVGEGLGAGWAVQHGDTLIVRDTEGELGKTVDAEGKPGIMRIAMPLRGRRATQGAIEIFNPRSEQMTDYAITFLHILADHAAIAIENAHAVARIQQLTITDDTTGLFNVRHLYDVLERELERSVPQRQPVSLAFLDMDRFKAVNDAHGHLVGSELLGRVGQRLQELSRKQDLCFRYGGDEFVILMPETNAEAALKQATELNRRLTDTRFQMKNGLELRVVASVGVATSPADGTTLHAVIGAADTRMYLVKSNGRGTVRGA